MKKSIFLLQVILGIMLYSLMTAQKSDLPIFVGNIEGVKEYSLKNGMQILLISDGSQSNMVVNIVYHVGSKDEGYGEKGMAHLLEHMLFKSTKNMGDIKKQLSDKGGYANGTTSYDRTNYFVVFPASDENLKWALNMEADRMINATLLQSDLDKEFSVVRNEFEISENKPTNVLFDKVYSTAYMWHNYGNSPIGSKEDIERVKVPALRTFYEKYYQPDNATLIIAGKFDEENALKYVAEKFSVLPKSGRKFATYTVEPAQDGEKTVELNRAGETKIIAAAYHVAAYADKDYAALAALGEILTANPSGYLYKNLVETQKASTVLYYYPPSRDPGIIYFNFNVLKDKDLSLVKDAVKTELNKIADYPYNETDLTRAKAKLLKQITDERSNTIDYAIALTEMAGSGNYKLGFLYRDNVEHLTVADLKRVATTYFKANNRTLGIFNPSSNEIRVKPAEFQAEQIAAITSSYRGKALEKEAAPFEASIANITKNLTEGTLSNGMKYGLIQKELPGDKMLATFKIPVGNEKDLAGKREVAILTAELLKSGTKTQTKEQIQDRLDQLQSSITPTFKDQTLVINLSTYKKNYVEVLAILEDLLKNSIFPQNELEKLIAEYKIYLQGESKDPRAIVKNELKRITEPYPKESIYYTPSLTDRVTDVMKVTRPQIVEFYQNILGSSAAAGTIIGKIASETAIASLEKTFGKWNAKSKYIEVKPTFFETKKIDKNYLTPDKENAVAAGLKSFKMNQKSTDYPAFVLANDILGMGGFMTSRITTRLREKEGISYGAGSVMDIPINNEVASWTFFALYNPTKRDAVEDAMKDEINKALREGFSAGEVAQSKITYANFMKTMLGIDEIIMELENNNLQYGFSLEEYDRLNAKVATLTVEEVNQALRKYLSLDQLTSVYAGDFNKK